MFSGSDLCRPADLLLNLIRRPFGGKTEPTRCRFLHGRHHFPGDLFGCGRQKRSFRKADSPSLQSAHCPPAVPPPHRFASGRQSQIKGIAGLSSTLQETDHISNPKRPLHS